MSNDDTIPYLERLYKSLIEEAETVAKTIKLARLRGLTLPSGGNQLGEPKTDSTTVAPKLPIDTTPKDSGPYSKYDTKASYKAKMMLVLSIEKRFLTVKEISDIIQSLEPNLKYDTIKQAIGSTKSALLKDNKIVKYVVGPSHNNSFYGSKQWLEEDGSIRPEHMYHEDALWIPRQDQIEL